MKEACRELEDAFNVGDEDYIDAEELLASLGLQREPYDEEANILLKNIHKATYEYDKYQKKKALKELLDELNQ